MPPEARPDVIESADAQNSLEIMPDGADNSGSVLADDLREIQLPGDVSDDERVLDASQVDEDAVESALDLPQDDDELDLHAIETQHPTADVPDGEDALKARPPADQLVQEVLKQLAASGHFDNSSALLNSLIGVSKVTSIELHNVFH